MLPDREGRCHAAIRSTSQPTRPVLMTTVARPRVPLPARVENALTALDRQPVDPTDKALPAGSGIALGEVGSQGWHLLSGDVPLPSLVLRQHAVRHNIELLQGFADEHDAWLAPHGKTTMAPQLFAQQLAAGAWAITVANVPQLRVCRAFQFPRVFIDNEVVSESDIRYIGEQLLEDPDFEVYLLVDSLAGIERLSRVLAGIRVGRPLPVLIEVGMDGGRTGIRDMAQLDSFANAISTNTPLLRLAGVEGYEGIIHGADADLQVDRYLERLAVAVRRLRRRAPAGDPFLVSAGGSVYFDRVVDRLGRIALPEAQLVLRSGGYITHDSEFYESQSPLAAGSPRRLPGPVLEAAIEVWSVVLSRPEPELAILGMGKRDVPTDLGLPTPLFLSRDGQVPSRLGDAWAVTNVNDQHTYLRLPAQSDLAVGDLIGSGISHPCTAFDRWRTILMIDDDRRVTGAVRTFF